MMVELEFCVYYVYVEIIFRFVALVWASANLRFHPLRLWVPFGFPWGALGKLWISLRCHGGQLGLPRLI